MAERLMQIVIDSADLAQIREWVSYGVIDGVTTNAALGTPGGYGAGSGRA